MKEARAMRGRRGGEQQCWFFRAGPLLDALACMTEYARARPTLSTSSARLEDQHLDRPSRKAKQALPDKRGLTVRARVGLQRTRAEVCFGTFQGLGRGDWPGSAWHTFLPQVGQHMDGLILGGNGALGHTKKIRVWVRKRDKERKGKGPMRVTQERMDGALCGGVCDLKEGISNRHIALVGEGRVGMAPGGVCMYRCRRADGEVEVVVGGLVCEKVGKSAYLFSNEFPSAWVHPVGCQTGGCLGRLKITTLAGPQRSRA
ncbi:hypothetical protein F5Y07DRAFT_116548 [Xylaria sp. FL0933]|nr:hypothetical protein F5Y07DRAFT_116548 [Xylaria sp. FL0933]